MAQEDIRPDGGLKETGAAADPFYSPENMRVLERSIRGAEEGKVTVHELVEC